MAVALEQRLRINVVLVAVQISKDELQTAMSFLKDQLGEDDLRLLLERMDAFSSDNKMDVNQLISLAEDPDPRRVQQTAH